MKVAVSAEGKGIDAPVDARFGRCPYFVIVNTEDMGFEAIENQSAALPGGAGVEAAQVVASTRAEAVITGSIGPKAARALESGNIQMITGGRGTVKEAVDDFLGGRLQRMDKGPPTSGSGSRVGGGGGMGRGRGGGQGRSMGRGRGGGRGPGRGRGRERGPR